ncbi:Anaphase-promoting complex subunit 1 [Geranomyces variabilis]|uniref:Anaphase-promoting complex subunit 1 n=1 Tax=Geranomyces variabilis TaxID=109894 RepID=A0AAD5XM51_9FUNG|nr:Anaphase-promoting complex subunit 1 [Geranomyces variabilis]
MEVRIAGSFTSCADAAADSHPFARLEFDGYAAAEHDNNNNPTHNNNNNNNKRSCCNSVCTAGFAAFDTELAIVGPTVLACRGGLTSRSYTTNGIQQFIGGGVDHYRPIRALYASFYCERSGEAPARPPALRRALAVFQATFLSLHFDSGASQDVPLPYEIELAWPLSVGILVKRRKEPGFPGEGAVYSTLNHPLDSFRPLAVAQDASNMPPLGRGVANCVIDDVLMVWNRPGQSSIAATYDRGARIHALWKVMVRERQESPEGLESSARHPVKFARILRSPVRFELIWCEGADSPLKMDGPAEQVFGSNDRTGAATIWFLSAAKSEAASTSDASHRRQLTVLNADSLENDGQEGHVRLSMPVLAATPLRATRADEMDVLVLACDNTLRLWTGLEKFIECIFSGLEFLVPSSTKRPLHGDMSDEPPPHEGPSFSTRRESRIVVLDQAADNRVTLVFSNGSKVRVALDFSIRSPLVTQCLEALYYSLPSELYEELHHRFLLFQYGAASLHSEQRQDEWENFTTAFFSFCHADVVTNPIAKPDHAQPGSRLEWLDRRGRGRRKERLAAASGGKRAAPDTLCASFQASKLLAYYNHVGSNLIAHLPAILILFHVVYEDVKLNTLAIRHQLALRELLYHLAHALGWKDYILHYQCDGQKLSSPMLSLSALHLLFHTLSYGANLIFRPDDDLGPSPIAPVDMYSWAIEKLRGSESSSVVLPISKLYSTTGPSIEMFLENTTLHRLCTLYIILTTKGWSAVAAKMAESNMDIETIPVTISLPLRQALENCRPQPCGNQSPHFYEYIERPDLAQQFKDTPLRFSQPAMEGASPDQEATHAEETASQLFDGTASVMTEVCTLRFQDDRRIEEVRRLVQSAKSTVAKIEVDYSAAEEVWKAEQQKYLGLLAQRVLARSAGRAALTFGTVTPTLTAPLKIPDLVVAAKFPPMTAVVSLDAPNNAHCPWTWPEFHNGVAAGLSVVANCPAIDGPWIVFTAPVESEESKRVVKPKHAGLLLGLGLTGNLKITNYDLIEYLNLKQDTVAIALLLGLAATHIGTGNLRDTRLCLSHIDSGEDLSGKPAGLEIKGAAVIAIGLLYIESFNRQFTERVLYLLSEVEKESRNIPIDQRESVALACGFALGFMTVGGLDTSSAAGIVDLKVGSVLLKCALLRDKPHIAISTTIALGLGYLRTNNAQIAGKLGVPSTSYLLNRLRPDILLLRILCANLIMWDQIEPSQEWIEKQLPAYIAEGAAKADSQELFKQARWNILTGACMAIGLKYAGSRDPSASNLLYEFAQDFLRHYSLPANTFSQKLDRAIVRECLDVIVTSLCAVMAGSGDVRCTVLVRQLHFRTGSDVTYGSHLAINTALGFLYLGGGGCTFGTSNRAIAVLLCALYPQYPVAPGGSNGLVRAARHLWALAVGRRCLVTRDVETTQMCNVPVKVIVKGAAPGEVVEMDMTTPALLPAYDDILSISTDGPRYWKNTLDVANNAKHRAFLERSPSLFVKRKMRYLSYADDRDGAHDVVTAGEAPLAPHDAMVGGGQKSRARGPETSWREYAAELQRAYPTAPALAAFAAYMCIDDNDAASTMCLSECARLDRVDVMLLHLWLGRLVMRAEAGNQQTPCVIPSPAEVRGLKIILALYRGFAADQRAKKSMSVSRPLLTPAFVNRVAACAERHFRDLFRLDDEAFDAAQIAFLNGERDEDLCAARLAWLEWPRGRDAEWLRAWVCRIAKGSPTAAAAQRAAETGVFLRFPRLPRPTAKLIVEQLLAQMKATSVA